MSGRADDAVANSGKQLARGRRPRRRARADRPLLALPLLIALGLSSLVIVAAAPLPVVAAGPYMVTSTSDTSDTAPGDGACVATDGGCTLRAAIEEANTTSDVDTIGFAIVGAGPHTITPTSPLPAVTETVTIDGYTQPGSQPNVLAVGNDADLRIVLSGASVGGVGGLDLSTSTNSSVSGLVVNGFSDGFSAGAGIVAGPGSNVVGNFIGTDAAGTVSQPNFHGVIVPGVDGVTIGGTDPGSRNLISGNTNFGVLLTDDADDNQVVGNYIGTNRDGTAALGNNFGVVMSATGGARLNDNFIGGDVAGAGNLISGNVIGVRVDFADDTRVLGNLIGTDATGAAAIPNAVGVDVGTSGSSPATRTFRTIIGNGTPGGRNVISGNDSEGISLWNQTDDNVVRGNYVGVGANGFEELGNNAAGVDPTVGGYGGIVLRNSSSGNMIGGSNPDDANLIAHNNDGVVVFSGDENRVVGNMMRDNLGGGIFVEGAEVNDAGDFDGGANRAQNFPVIRRVGVDDSENLLIEASIDSDPAASTYPITVDFYNADTAGSGEGYERIGTQQFVAPGIITADLGNAQALAATPGYPIVATATDAAGNTSNFSDVAFVDQPERLAPSNPGDRFGQALDVDGNRMVVASPGADVGAEDAGVVQVFERTDADSPWLLTATIPSPAPQGDGGFGDSVALNGDLVAVGESDAYGGSDEAGRVWVFERQGPAYVLLHELEAPLADQVSGDRFGIDVAWLDGDDLIIGAPGTVLGGDLYRADVTSGAVTNITPLGMPRVAGDEFGFAVDVTPRPDAPGYWAAVGAPGQAGTGGPDGGGSFLLTLDAAGAVTARRGQSGLPEGTRWGTSVSVDGNRAVIGRYGTSGPTATMGFALYEYRDFGFGVEWASEVSRSVASSTGFEDGLPANAYIEIDGETIAVGRPGDGGGVAVFEFVDDVLSAGPAYLIEPSDRQPGDRIGRALALAGPTLAVGAPGDGGVQGEFSASGAVRTYRVATTATFVNSTGFAPWENPINWDIGAVPGPGDSVIVPFGSYPQINDATSVAYLGIEGNVRVRAPFAVTDELKIGALGGIDVQGDPGDSLTLPSTVTLDGQINNVGPVIVDGPTSITGSGSIVNDGELRKQGSGTLTIGSGIDWTSRFYSEVNVQQGRVEILGPLVESSGTFRVAAGTTLAFAGDLTVGPGSRFVTRITGASSDPANFGQIQVGGLLGFDAAAPNPGSGTVGLTATIDGYGVTASDAYRVITCASECVYGPGVGSIEFDDLDLSGLDVVIERPSVNVQLIENKIPSPDGAFPRFGYAVDIDGDWAVVGAPTGGIAVFERVLGAWEFRESMGGNPGASVAIGGNYLAADGVLWSRNDPSEQFAAPGGAPDTILGGTSVDIDGNFLITARQSVDDTATVFTLDGSATEVVLPVLPNPSLGQQVSVVDLGGGSAVAAVADPFTSGGAVYTYAISEVGSSLAATPGDVLTSPDADDHFGDSLALSADRLVVGEPLNATPDLHAGAAWVYERTGNASFGSPVKLRASDAGTSDTFGTDVDIDGDVIVVGAGAAQKFNFPFRDGVAYVFRNDGAGWVETDILRAPDGFNGERFGDAVAVSGMAVFVGAPQDTNNVGPAAGAVYTYDIDPLVSTVNTYSGPAPSIAPGNWANPLAWSFGVVPGPTDAAVIPAGKYVQIKGPGSVSVGSVNVAGSLSVLETPSSPGVRFEILDDSLIASTGRLVVGGSIDCTVDGVVTVLPDPFPADECVPSTTTLALSANLQVDGDFETVEQVLAYGGGIFIKSSPVIELDDGASLSGSGSVLIAARVVKADAGTVTFGPDLDVELWYGASSDSRGELVVTAGTLDIRSGAPGGSFVANGTIQVAAGASLSVAGDLALSATSVLDFGIAGPSSSAANYGRIVLPTGTLTADGTLRVIADGYAPTSSDTYPLIGCTTGSCVGGAFSAVEIDPLTMSTSTGVVSVRGPEVPIELDFELGLGAGAPASLAVAPSGIAVNTLDRNAVAKSGGTSSNIAGSPITAIGPEDTSLASIQLGATPLRAVVLESDVLSAIPLINIDIDGGWDRIIGLSEALRREPLSSLTFGQVLAEGDPLDSQTPAGALAATPLRAVDVDGTPLRAVSLAAIALGSTPLRAVPLRAVGPGEPDPWCEYLGAELLAEYPTGGCEEALDDLSLLEATLRGASIAAAPLRAVPLRAVDVAQSPLRAVLLEDIALGASPVGAIPLRAVPLRAVDLEASPLRAVPLRAVPLRAVPVSAIDLEQIGPNATPLRAVEINSSPLRAVNTSITLDAAPLRAVDADGTPVSAIQVEGAPLRAVPLTAVMLADVPLRAVPLEGNEDFDWCAVLADVGDGFDCDNGVDLDVTTVGDLSIRGVPLRAVPLRAVPLRAVLQDATIGTIPLRAVPLRAVPLRAVPLGGLSVQDTAIGSIPVNGTPLRAVPLRAVDLQGTSLGTIPLRAVAPGAIPLHAVPLRAVPLRAVPLRAVPLRAVDLAGTLLADTPLRAVDVLGSPLRAVPLRAVDRVLLDCAAVDCDRGTLGDALLRGAISQDVTLEQIQAATESIDLADLAAALDGVDAADLLAAFEAAGLTLEDLLTLDGLTLGDLPSGMVELDAVELGTLLNGLTVGSFADLVEAIIDPATGEPVAGLEQELLDAIASLNLLLGDLERLGDVTLGDILDGDHPITLADIEPVLRFVTVDELQRALNVTVDLGLLTLGDLTPEQLGQLTLADLSALEAGVFDGQLDIADLLEALGLTDAIDGLTLGDLLLALVDPASLTYGGVDFADVDVAALPSSTVGTTTFDASFTLTASSARSIELQIQVPRSAGYVTGSGQISGDGVTDTIEPDRFGGVLTWSFVAQPGVAYTITFDVLPTLTLGSTSLAAVARVIGTDISVLGAASVTVVEGTEPNDFTTVDETTKAAEDIVYLTYIADPTDIDVFEITVAEDDELIVELSNLDADLDLALWGRNETPGTSLARPSADAPLFAVKDPDADSGVAEPLDDFPQLNEVDPTLGLIDVSNSVGTENERLESGRLNAGTYYIEVVGANGAVNVQPAALQLKVLEADERPECMPISLPTFSGAVASAPDLGGADTLLLINERRLEQLHGADARVDVRAAADRLVAAADADPNLGISPVVVPVDAYPAVQDAYDAWDSAGGSCDPDAANAVVAAINDSIIDAVRENLTHVVILGPDELIPMARLADETDVANEYDYRHEFDGDLTGVTQAERNGRNAFTSVAWESSILSDDPYGESAARSLGDRFLYVTDLALGRVVESPADIVDALDTYVSFDGTLDIDTAAVLGYDFLADGSAEIAGILADTLPVDDDLALGPDPTTPGDAWTAARATDKLAEASTNALVSLNAHFDHYRSLPAIGDKVAGFDDNLIAATVRDELRTRLGLTDPLAQSLIFSMGCHSGLSVSDITIGRTNQDWAQTLGQQGSLFIGNTGFGYGDTKTVAYTEQLMALFAAQVTAPFDTGDGSTTVGQALAWAKNEFVAGLQTFSVYDEKAVQESTFYGLPFYRVGLDTEPLPPVPTAVTEPDATGTPSVQVTLDPTNDAVDDGSGDGTYFANTDATGNELVIVAPGQPIQPKVVEDVSIVDPSRTTRLGEIARGAIVLDMESTYQSLPNPVIATPIFDESASQPEPSLTAGVFPTKPLSITTTTGPSGQRQQLVVATGQYSADSDVQRLDDDIDVVVYYADPLNPDVTAPVVGAVSASITGGSLTVSLTAGVEPGDGVDRVYLLVAENPTVSTSVVDWKGLDLTRTPGTNRWTGSLTLAPGTTDVEFIVQAKDPAGNVGYATNKARNFGQVASAPSAPPPPPPPTQLSVAVPTAPPSGWFDGSVEITIAAAATPASVVVNGVQRPGTFAAGQTFTIAADGVQNWTVVTEAGRTTSGTVRVDADGAPRVVLGVPSGTGTPVYPTGTRRVDVICRDTSLVSCALTIDGTPVTSGDPLPTTPGTYTLAYRATDQVGRETTGSAPFRIATVVAPPVISSAGIPTAPQPIADGVAIATRFTDASVPFDTFTATVDWGDGEGPQPAAITPPTIGVPGTIAADRNYTETGEYTVEVTVIDAAGAADSTTSTIAVFDPAAPPVIRSFAVPAGDRLLTTPVDVTASFTDRSVPVDNFSAMIDWGDGTVEPVDVSAPTFDSVGSVGGRHVYGAPGLYTVVVSVADESGNIDTEGATITVVAPSGKPVITGIAGPGTPLRLSDVVTIGATFSDASAPYDTFSAVVDWGDGTTTPATVTPPTTATGEGSITASRTYTATGVYPVTVRISDARGDADDELFEFVVVYDPTINGRVTGSGFYWSGAEASAETSRWGAPAFFGYDAKYKKNSSVPTGETKLRLLGQFFFQSTQYDYLIVNDAMAIAEGTGTIGGGSEYRFRVQGIDNGWLDFFQITIWNPATGAVLYDNGVLYDKGDVVLLGGIQVKGG